MARIDKDFTLKNIGNYIKNSVADVLGSSDFISRTIGMNNSYEDIMFIVQALGRQPVSLLGKDYPFIFDHVRRNYMQGTYVSHPVHGKTEPSCAKFTFYKERPTVRFADPYDDPQFLKDRWFPDYFFETNLSENVTRHYSESQNENYGDNRKISAISVGSGGTAHDTVESYNASGVRTCDIIKKTNDYFNSGRYRTLIARFHTGDADSTDPDDTTQTAISRTHGMSHGRNLLKLTPDAPNGYDNPYCRVWTYHHQYNTMSKAIRPFGEASSQEELESLEQSGDYQTVGFRTTQDKEFEGGSKRLDKYGVLDYRNGFVHIAPTAKLSNYFDDTVDDKSSEAKKAISTKKCMFSIENLAWRNKNKRHVNEFDPEGLSPEQIGPMGGRIMWFPPYDIKFSESVNVRWNENQFIGRGEGVYTYTNTERSGMLSFKLIIDHPSIIDYWTGHKRNGMKNQGMPLLPGNTHGVDGKDNQEQTLLRFFAGCDILSASPQRYKKNAPEPEKEEEPKPAEPTPPPSEVAEPQPGKMYAILYYPNNYSGVDDDAEFAVNYLMFGIGAQKSIRKTEDGSCIVEDVYPSLNAAGGIGYEVNGEGISNVSWADISGTTKYGTTSDCPKSEGYAEFITNALYYDNKTILPAKQIGNTASKGADSTSPTSEWKYKRWFYRVDSSTQNQRLTGKPSNYIDGKSWGLNSTGYSWVKENVKSFNLTDEDELVSFTDLYCALVQGANLPHDAANTEKIRKIFKEEGGYKVKKLTFKGHNSSHGRYQNNKQSKAQNEAVNVSRNKTLATKRADTFKNWMSKMGFPMADKADATKTLSETTEKNTHKMDSVDDEYIKAWRSASVIIEYEKSDVEDAATAEGTEVLTDENNNVVELTDAEGKPMGVFTTRDRVTVANKETSSNPGLQWHQTLSEKTSDKGQSVGNTVGERMAASKVDDGSDGDESAKPVAQTQPDPLVNRYDNEGEFFELLTKEEPFLHHLITDKIKYFDPAFHSISPEGFNARLTFLHQCTRQGSTVEKASFDTSTAYNLAFGRPPVCVLRVGDFYYTKIIIESLQINYEDVQWDLNPEGIGVMPMFADVTLQFKFLGGSDLAGPIARLQNAVSFNYYANTSVYDNRAETVEYDPSKNGKETQFKGFAYPNIHKSGEVPKAISESTTKSVKDAKEPSGVMTYGNNPNTKKVSLVEGMMNPNIPETLNLKT